MTTGTHVLVASQRGGAPADEGELLQRLANAAESAMARARASCATPGGDAAATGTALRDAELAVGTAMLHALNLGATAGPVVRWREARRGS
jgi:hypothetical protein